MGPFPVWGCRSPQELTVPKYALTAANELRCPHHQNQTCWTPATPLGTLPTQTCSCSPTPAAFSALCKPLLCLQSAGWDQKAMTAHTICFTVNQHYQIHTYWQTQFNSTECKATEFQINPMKSVSLQLPEGLWEAPWTTLYPPQSATGLLPLLYYSALRSSPQFYLKRNIKHTTHTLYNQIKKHQTADNQDEEWWEHKSGWKNTTKPPLIYWTVLRSRFCPQFLWPETEFDQICDYLTADEGESHTRPSAPSRLSIFQQNAQMVVNFSSRLPILLCKLVNCLSFH